MLTPRQIDLLRAAVDRIIPADEYPSGWGAGVGDYILRQLEEDDLNTRESQYMRWLNGLDAEAQARHGVGFVELDVDAQDALLVDVEQGKTQAELWATHPADFFNILLIQHVHEGFYSDPSNGGNRGGIAWQMIGFEVTG